MTIKLRFIGSFREKNINFVNDLTKENGKFKTWEQITDEYKIDKGSYFKKIQLVHIKPNYWKKASTENTTKNENLSYLTHYLIKSNQIHSVFFFYINIYNKTKLLYNLKTNKKKKLIT